MALNEGTGGSKTRWIKTSYPEIDREEKSLIAETSLLDKKHDVGIYE